MQNVANGGSHGQIRQGVLRDLFDGLDVLIDGAVVDWNCDNRKLPQAKLTSTQSFALNMTNVLDGSQGILKIVTDTASAITITFDTDFTNKSAGAIGQSAITNFTLRASADKEYIISFVCDGSTIYWFFDSGVIIDWSTGINPSGWSSFTKKEAFYIDMGAYYILSWIIEGTGSGTTAGFTLPIAATNLFTGSLNYIFLTQTVNNATVGAGVALLTPGSTSVDLRSTVAQANWTNATSRTCRGTATILK